MKKYEVEVDGYEYLFKVLAGSAKQAKRKVRRFLRVKDRTMHARLAKCQKLYIGYPLPAA